MILKTNKARISITQKDLSKEFKGQDYKDIEFVFKNPTFTQEMEILTMNSKLEKIPSNDENVVEMNKTVYDLIKLTLSSCLFEVKGFKDEEGNDLSVSEQFITDLVDFNIDLASEIVQAFSKARVADKKK